MKAHTFRLTNHVKQILEIKSIKDGLIYKTNGEVAKVFRVQVEKDYHKLDKNEKKKFEVQFREYLEQTKSEVQINLITNNYYADTYVERIKKQIKENQAYVNPEAVNSFKNLVHYIESQTKGSRPVREFYITISFDDYSLRGYQGVEKLKSLLIDNYYLRLSKLNKGFFGKKIIQYENELSDTQIYNYQRHKKLINFFEEEVALIHSYFKVDELNDEQVISLYNSHFYENVYKDGYYYTILDFIELFVKQTNNPHYIDLVNIFKWKQKFDFTTAQINQQHYRILSFFEYPIFIKPEFWEFIISHGGNFNISFFFKQTTKKEILLDLERRKKEIENKSSYKKQLGFIDEEIENELSKITNIISFVQQDEEKAFLMSVYVLLKEINKDKVQKFSDEISILLNENKINFKIQPLKNIVKDFDIVLPINKNDMKNYKFLTSTSTMNLYPFLWDFTNIQNRDKIKELHK